MIHKGLEDVLENRLRMIRNNPIILKKWTMHTRQLKEELTRIPVWVKIHDVPLRVFSEDGISLIATKISNPIMLNSYTSSMCIDSWRRSSIARCLIEVKTDDVLKESVTMGLPLLDGSGVHDQCPKNITVTPIVDKSNDGFQMVVNKEKNGKTGSSSNSNNRNGVKIGGQSVQSNVKYVSKVAVNVPKTRASKSQAPTIWKNMPPKASVLLAFSSGNPNDKNDGDTSNILVSIPCAALD
nr:zinc knuckle CX2CX4HX4C [Tanacetum cinerariifolium]